MKFSALSRTGFAVALSAVLASMMAPTQAETLDNMFAKVSPSVRDRMYFRLNYIYANVKTTSGEAYDVTGPVLRRGDIATYLGPNNTAGAGGTLYQSPHYATCSTTPATACVTQRGSADANGLKAYNNTITGIGPRLENAIQDDIDAGYTYEANGLGTPAGIKAKSADSAATPALSVGYFLSDDYTWFVEGYVLAAPLSVTVKGDGVNASGLPNGINGKDIIRTKLLPPTAVLGRYFGRNGDVVRPFAGFGASYAMFFDVRATDELNQYQGGRSSGDTTINLKSSLGFGPFIGVRGSLNEDWHVSLTVGKLRYKTEATLTTRNTTITSNTGVLLDYAPNVANANGTADSIHTTSDGYTAINALMCDLAAAKLKNNDCNFGTYVRKQSTVLDNTMFMFSVGRSF